MENTERVLCLECGRDYNHRRTLMQHVKVLHKMKFDDYNRKHNLEQRMCHCGKALPEQQRAKHGGGRTRLHCSIECNKLANHCERTYGISVQTYWEQARKGCAICGATESVNIGRKLAVDHDHATGKFRGILCHDCNVARVGMNTLETAQRVIEYLKR
jgi:hypothetical protein